MTSILSMALRAVARYLIKSEITYYPGMVVVRIGRLLRKLLYKKNHRPEYHIIKVFNNVLMKVNRFSYMGGCLYWTSFHHINETIYLMNNLKSNMIFIDIGANQGEFSLLAASLLSKGKVLAFEPVSIQRNLLITNIEINKFKNLEVFSYGLGNKEQNIPIFTSLETNIHHGIHEGLSSVYPTRTRSELQEYILIKEFDKIFYNSLMKMDFIKIDIEGGELFALMGMEKSITKFKPKILIEINEETFNSAGYSSSDVFSFLKNLGYQFYNLSKGKIGSKFDTNIKSWGNLIAVFEE